MNIIPRIFNRRKTKNSNQPTTSGRRGLFIGGSFTFVDEDIAMTVSAMNRGVIYIATQMAKLPWNVKDANKEVIDSHELNFLLNRCCVENYETTSFMVKVFLIIQAIMTGNAFAEIDRGFDGKIKGIYPLLSADVQLWRREDGRLVYLVNNYSGGQVVLFPEEIYHLRNFHTKDALSGQGIVSYAATTLGISVGADKFANSLFSNSGLPSGSLEVQGTLSDTAFERLRESWKAAVGGAKTGSVAILEEGTKFNPITFAPDVLQFIETRKFGVPEIARFLGVPPTKLYSQEQATYNNNEQDNMSVINDTISAWASNMENEADLKFFGKNMKYHTEIDLFEIAKGDMNTRSDYYQRMFGLGAMTSNQIRKKEGMSSHKDGDRYYVAANNFVPVEHVDTLVADRSNTSKSSKELDEAVIDYLKK